MGRFLEALVRHLCLTLLFLSSTACGGAPAPVLSYGESARRDYERAQAAFEDNDCITASPLFSNVRREYPYSRYAALSELRLADCELREQHYSEAIRAYRAFARQRPTHPDVDSANFSVALAYYKQIPQEFILSPPPEERDQIHTRNALRIVRRFLIDFPDSEHVEEARRIEREVLALLARHELYVARYYLTRDHGQATIQRIDTLLREFEGSGVEPEALILKGRTYLHLRQRESARDAFQSILERFPTSGYADQARHYLAELDLNQPAPDDDAEEPDAGEWTNPLDPGALMPGTDIDDVTDGNDPAERSIDDAEDASEAGISVTPGQGVRAGDTSSGRTAGSP
jgi:outer membrane protein assembly factor BamD